MSTPGTVVDELAAAGLARGDLLAVAPAAGVGLGLAAGARRWSVPVDDPFPVLARIEARFRPRWTWWGRPVPEQFVAAGLRPAACWDIGAVHQLIFGGGRADAGTAWAAATAWPPGGLPTTGQLDLLGAAGDDGGDPAVPVRPDGYLRPEWTSGGWAREPARLAAWAGVTLDCALAQRRRLDALTVGGDPVLTAWSESAAEQLCAELQHDGLPLDVGRAEELITAAAGRRPVDETDAERLRRDRDAPVLALTGPDVDLRNPAQVKAELARIGIDVPDTRSWRLEPLRGSHPLVDALLQWRRADRIATTYGWSWLDRERQRPGGCAGRGSAATAPPAG